MQVGDPDLQAALQLQKTLCAYRQQPISGKLKTIKEQYSMLHVDALIMLYHFAKVCRGPILEIGTYVGGATIAMAWGIRDSGEKKKLICVEPGGAHNHPKIPSKDILADLKRNLRDRDAAGPVTIIEGYSWDAAARAKVDKHLGAGEVGLFVVDSDGGVQREMDSYGSLLAPDSLLVFDDYREVEGDGKHSTAVPQIDALVTERKIAPLGVFGWGTFYGRNRA